MVLRGFSFIICIITLITCLLVAGCGNQKQTKTLKLAHGLSNRHPVHKGMEFMAKRVAEKSDGALRIQVYPSEQLGTERQCLELLQVGSLDMTKVSTAVMEAFAPTFKVYSVPYLFDDENHRFSVLDGPIGQEVLKDGEEFWLRGLCYYDAGSRSFYTTKKPIYTPDDLNGMKIRVMESPSAIQLIQEMGGSPTPISWGELYTSLQQGVVDGAENNPPSYYQSKHYEVAKYYTLNEHTSVPDVLIISTKTWTKLTPQEQEWLQEAANESAQYQRKLWKESTEEALREVQKAGVKVIYPDKSLFKKKVQGIDELYRKDEQVYSLIQRIRAYKNSENKGESH